MKLRKAIVHRHSKKESGWYYCSFCGFTFKKDVNKNSRIGITIGTETNSYMYNYLKDPSYNYLLTPNGSHLIVSQELYYGIINVSSGCPFCGGEIRI